MNNVITMTPELMPPVERAIALTALEAERVPSKPGIYAAWLVDRAAFRDLGVRYNGDPQPVYIGIAKERGLKARLTQHVRRPFFDLAELLASRGRVLYPWHQRDPVSPGSRFRPGPLCRVSETQTLEWQHQNLRWSWLRCTSQRAVAREREAIASHDPLLNRQHASPEPPRLRWAGGYEHARARWLWQIAWAGLNIDDRISAPLSEVDYLRWQLDGLGHRVDEAGYPLPRDLWSSDARRIQLPINWPTTESIHARMKRASKGAEPAVRQALADRPNPAEMKMWWAVHYAARFLPDRWDLEGAMNLGLCMADERDAPGPARLPKRQLRDSLILLERALYRVRK